MPRKNPKRKQWDIACAVAGTSTGRVAKGWRCSKSAINGVLAGKITSAALEAKIDAFIEKNANLPNGAEAA